MIECVDLSVADFKGATELMGVNDLFHGVGGLSVHGLSIPRADDKRLCGPAVRLFVNVSKVRWQIAPRARLYAHSRWFRVRAGFLWEKGAAR